MPKLSPGVEVRELDFSQYVAKISTTIVGMVGAAEWGPEDVPTYTTNENGWVTTFGIPLPDTETHYYGPHGAVQFLKQGNQLWYNRIATGSVKATLAIKQGATTVITATARYGGGLGNRLRVKISNAIDGDADHFRLEIFGDLSNTNTWKRIEDFGSVTNETAESGASYPATDPFTKYRDLATVNGISRYIDFTLVQAGRPTNTSTATYPYGEPLANGTNGTASLSDSDYIGNASNKQGIYAFRNRAKYDINVLVVPGAGGVETDKAITAAMIEACEYRQDCIAILDPPNSAVSSDVIDWSNGLTGGSNALNSSYAALYWSWIYHYDPYNKKTILCPPSGWIASVYAYNDRVAGSQFAPMGVTRGRLTLPSGLAAYPDEGDNELLYGNNNIVNPIVAFPQFGITVWGQRTTQRVDSALDRVNVRRMLIALEKAIATSAIYLVGEPNDPITWRSFIHLVRPALDNMKANRGILAYDVKCDATTNSAYLMDNNTMRGIIILKPTKAAEVIQIDFVITSQGADFNEILTQLVES